MTRPALKTDGRELTAGQHAVTDGCGKCAQSSLVRDRPVASPPRALSVALLTGGGDRPYALGVAAAVTSVGINVDFIGSDDLWVPELLSNSRVNFINLRGDQRAEAATLTKVVRLLRYYTKLLAYVARAKPKLFHILWNNKFEVFDRTLLMLYYRMFGKRILLTAHNVNKAKRDQNDSRLNRVTLKIQYRLSDHIFVHTEGMKSEMAGEFRIPEEKISVIPFGINNTVPNTTLSSTEAKCQLGLTERDKSLLFFGNIAPYKGLEYLVSAFMQLLKQDSTYRLLIVGRPKGRMDYWERIDRTITSNGIVDRVIARIEYVPDEQTELYFKAADVMILPYTHIFQSGVLFLGYGFGLPAIVADIGSLKEEIIEGRTGLIFRPRDPADLAYKIQSYFQSELFRNLESRRLEIRAYANERYSWDKVAAITATVYARLVSSDLRQVEGSL
jgi:glycosyltransferase involved in cell wall biosynthesis